mmetsp:Transcript_2618/g.2209  ORF Transcript_2618/g.2209 Transcript_2618/m.2209 type:complete len:173 (+) Transcript_2618:329-847(+)
MQLNILEKDKEGYIGLGSNETSDTRKEKLKIEMIETKGEVKKRDKELREIERLSQLKVNEYLRVQKEVRKIQHNLNLLTINKFTVEMAKERERNNQHKFVHKIKDSKKQIEAEETLHITLMRRFDRFINAKENEIQQTKDQIKATNEKNQILEEQVLNLREMSKNKVSSLKS